MAKRDYYEVLGVSRDVDAGTLKAAYRKLALRYHPDRSEEPDASERFKEATEAYGVLSDPGKRERYDLGGHAAVDGSGPTFDPGSFADFGDLFGVFGQMFGMDFGGGPRRARSRRGDDLLYEMEVEFVDAALGAEKELEVPRLTRCSDCGGDGAAPGSGRTTCSACGGRGQVVLRQGIFSLARPCGSCQGAGTVLERPCPGCGGQGRREERKPLRLKIPAGVDSGQRIRVAGAGEDGPLGGPPGDLIVQLRVAPHELFERDGADLHLRLPLSFPQVALGAQVTVPTLEGEREVTIAAGTEAGEVIRVRGQGIAKLGASGRGDLYLHVRVRTPKRLTSKQRKLLESYRDSVAESYEIAEEKGFFDRVRDLFG